MMPMTEHNRGGYGVTAIRLISEAIDEVEAGIAAGS